MTDPSISFDSEKAADVLIIGGGVIGAACAYELAKAGAAVTVIDQGRFGGACSHGNCGYVAPSHILPLCQPGAIWSTIKTMFQRNSAFSITPRFDFRMWNWFVRFALNCNRSHMLYAGRARQALLNASRTRYEELINEGELTNCDWHTDGLLFVHHRTRDFEHHAVVDALLEREFGLSGKSFAGSELNTLEPALKEGFGGGWLYECDAHVRPDELMSAWKRLLTSLDIRIIESSEVTALDVDSGRVSGVVIPTGRISANQIVLAAGAWSPLLGRQLRMSLPIQPGKGYSITMPRPKLCPKYPMIFEEHHVAVTPMTSGYRIGSTMEFSGYDARIRESRLQILIDGATHYLKEPMADPIQERWQGWRPMSADGIPMIGRAPNWSNVWVASGHSMLGVSMAPSTGQLIRELIMDQPPHVDPHPYRVERFA